MVRYEDVKRWLEPGVRKEIERAYGKVRKTPKQIEDTACAVPALGYCQLAPGLVRRECKCGSIQLAPEGTPCPGCGEVDRPSP